MRSRPQDEALIKRVCARFYSRDVDGVVAGMHGDVTSANGREGGHVFSHDGLSSYRTRQRQMVDPHIEPLSFSVDPDGGFLIEVNETVRDRKGRPLSDKVVRHFFRSRTG